MSRAFELFLFCSGACLTLCLAIGEAVGQNPGRFPVAGPNLVACSPAPCVLPPTQASEGGGEVTDAPIVPNPLNPKQLLLGSSDFNCPSPSALGFHYSSDGGSTWSRTCMPTIITSQHVYWPGGQPSVGYDLNGTAYIAGDYFDSEGLGYGLVGLQKSSDGINWSNPVAALEEPLSFATYSALVIDTNAGSPYLNTIYVSAVLIGPPGDNSKNRVVVSRSMDGGTKWSTSPADPTQASPAEDNFTSMSLGADGTAYLTWLHCLGGGPGAHCDNGKAYMVFSRSKDGGNTWSVPSLAADVTMPHDWTLPNSSVRVYNYPAIGVDNSSGPYAERLYVVKYTWTGTYMRVQVIHSSDGGSTWSKPVPVALT